MTAINAGGGDYQGLPTTPIPYRARDHRSTIDWNTIDAQYVANGGIVDPDVWPVHKGKVVTVDNGSQSSRKVTHSWVEANKDTEQGEPAKRGTTAKFGMVKRRQIADAYLAGESIRTLADTHKVSISAIRTALRNEEVDTRSRNEAQAVRYQQQAAS